jgi:predicted RNase H-like HicB family nuclease
MKFQGYRVVSCSQEDGSWVAEIPAISGCYSLMQTKEEALAELEQVFLMIAAEFNEKGRNLPVEP